MSKIQNSYQVVSKKIIHEMIDNEVIIVNLENGHYYSVTNSGGLIWQMIVAGYSIDKIVHQLKSHFNLEDGLAEADLRAFLDSLVKENLIIEDAGSGEETNKPEVDLPPGDYEKPELEVYTDIEELLLLDPIHEVDEAGWPKPGPGQIG